MNKNQINKSRMYSSVDLVLDNHASLFGTLGELTDAHLRLKNGAALIRQHRQVQEADVSGLTKNKIQLRANMIKCILQFSAAIMAFATSAKDEELRVKANYGLSDLNKSPDPLLLDIGTLLMGLANPLKSDLSRFFIGDAEFKEMDHLLVAFKQAIPQRRVATSASKVSTGNINELFHSQDALLKQEIDVLMLPFQFTQPDFYNAYRNARSIVDYAGRGKAKPEGALPG